MEEASTSGPDVDTVCISKEILGKSSSEEEREPGLGEPGPDMFVNHKKALFVMIPKQRRVGDDGNEVCGVQIKVCSEAVHSWEKAMAVIRIGISPE